MTGGEELANIEKAIWDNIQAVCDDERCHVEIHGVSDAARAVAALRAPIAAEAVRAIVFEDCAKTLDLNGEKFAASILRSCIEEDAFRALSTSASGGTVQGRSVGSEDCSTRIDGSEQNDGSNAKSGIT